MSDVTSLRPKITELLNKNKYASINARDIYLSLF